MKKQLINIPTTPLVQAMAPILVIVATVLALSALVAQPYGKSQPDNRCKKWPLEQDQAKVEAAFDKILIDSTTDKSLRDELLDTSNCYKRPKAAVQRTLGDTVKIPDEVVIIFYENDSPDFLKPRPPFDDYPSDHCLHIFFLPPFGSPVAKTGFRENLMCCYKPWKPTRPTPSK